MLKNNLISLGRQNKENWISVAKFVAVMAVIIDHTTGILYEGYAIKLGSYFSVTLFILVMGITTFWSFERTEKSGILKRITNRTLNLLLAYVIANFLCILFRERKLDMHYVTERIRGFDLYGPFYYVMLYIQLLWVSPIVYHIITYIKKKPIKVYKVLSVSGGVILVSILAMKYTNFFDIDAGGGKLFGGSYLIVLFMGMFAGSLRASHFKAEGPNFKLLFCGILLLVMTVFFYKYIYYYGFLNYERYGLGNGINPPGIEIIIFSILILSAIFCGVNFFETVHYTFFKFFVFCFALIGNHTLYVFLYHKAIIDFLKDRMNLRQGAGKSAIYVLCIFGGSALCEQIIKRLRTMISKCYK